MELTEGKTYQIKCKISDIEYNEEMTLERKIVTMFDSPNDIAFIFELKGNKEMISVYPDDIYSTKEV